MKVKSLSPVGLFVTPWTVAYQSPQSMDFFRQEYWSGLSFPSPGGLPDPGIESASPKSPPCQARSLPLAPPGKPLKVTEKTDLICSYTYTHTQTVDM